MILEKEAKKKCQVMSVSRVKIAKEKKTLNDANQYLHERTYQKFQLIANNFIPSFLMFFFNLYSNFLSILTLILFNVVGSLQLWMKRF